MTSEGLWPLVVLVWVVAFLGGYLGARSALTRPTRAMPGVPVRGDVQTIVERR